MRKIHEIFLRHTSNASSARKLIEELLQKMPRGGENVRKELRDCISKLQKIELAERKTETETIRDQELKELRRQHRSLTEGKDWDPRDDPDWRPY